MTPTERVAAFNGVTVEAVRAALRSKDPRAMRGLGMASRGVRAAARAIRDYERVAP